MKEEEKVGFEVQDHSPETSISNFSKAYVESFKKSAALVGAPTFVFSALDFS